jgi:hypothetical protein
VLRILSRLGYYVVKIGQLLFGVLGPENASFSGPSTPKIKKKKLRNFDTLENECRHGVTSPRLECSAFLLLLRITSGICPTAYTLNNYSVMKISIN